MCYYLNVHFQGQRVKIYRSTIFPFVLYGCGTLSLTSREEHKLRVFGNRLLRRIFAPKRGKAKGQWRRLHNEELNALYSSSSIIQMIQSIRIS